MRLLRFWSIVITSLILFAPCISVSQDTQPDIFIVARVGNDRPFMGEQFMYEVRVYDSTGLPDLLYRPPGFEGFWKHDLGVVNQQLELVEQVPYTVTVIQTILFPTQIGVQSISPANVVISNAELSSESIIVEVGALPEPVPHDFTGLIGHLSLTASLGSQRIRLGEASRLNLSITGTGNMEHFVLIPPTTQWTTTLNADSYFANVQDAILLGTRDYEILMYPDQSGLFTLPTVTLSYFDPLSLSYKRIETASISVEVLNPDNLTVGSPIDSESSQGSSEYRLRSIFVYPVIPISGILLGFMLPVLGVTMILLYRRWSVFHSERIKQNRQQKALQTAKTELLRLRSVSGKAQFERISHIVDIYFASKSDGTIKIDEELRVFRRFAKRDLSPHLSVLLDRFADRLMEGLYGPPSDQSYDAQFIHETIEVLNLVDSEWNKFVA